MWWMWHGPEGHWVINETPGFHGNDIIKSTFEDVLCPNEVFNWEDQENSETVNQFICTEDITTTFTTTTEEPCVPLTAGNTVVENVEMGPEWEVEIDFKLNEINPDTTTNILNVQAKNENGVYVFGEHGVKIPGCT